MYRVFNKVVLYRTEITVTQRCTLNCEKCSNLMPHFSSPVTYELDAILKEMCRLFECVDRIQILRILGGEPFIHKNITEIVRCAAESSKVKYVEIVSNGTILPSDEILKSLKNNKVSIVISDYRELSRKKEEIQDACKRIGVNCRIYYNKPDDKWLDAGDLSCRKRNKKQLEEQVVSCAMMCRNVQNGRLYYCPRASFGACLGIPGKDNDSVDLLNGSIKELRNSIYRLNQNIHIVACNYCDMGTKEMNEVEIAKQVSL